MSEWLVELRDGNRRYVHADRWRIYDGALIFSVEDVEEDETDNVAFPAGLWAFVWPATGIWQRKSNVEIYGA